MVRTRFAPSPTGFLHIGGLRTALYSCAYARANKGKFILRIEDTDQKRQVAGATEAIYTALKTFGISWDEGPLVGGPYDPYIQSERVKTDIYKKCAERLLADGHAYRCFCKAVTKEEVKKEHKEKKALTRDPCRELSPKEIETKLKENYGKYAIRLRVPDQGEVSYRDFVLQKEVKWDLRFVDEAMLLKSDGFPTYHLGVVVDDLEMKISHIIRGRDWLPSTPVHLLLYKYLNLKTPEIGHLTDIQDPEGGKLSKRKGSVSCEQMLAEGYLPEAILNFIMLLGWAPKDDRELFSLEDFVKVFTIEGLNKANPVFNREKLLWFNKQYLMKLSDKQYIERFSNWVETDCPDEVKEEYKVVLEGIKKDSVLFERAVPLIKERVGTWTEVLEMVKFLFVEQLKYSADAFTDIKSAPKKADLAAGLRALAETFGTKWNDHADWEARVRAAADSLGWKHGDLFMVLRIAIIGSRVSPPLDLSMDLLGHKRSLIRVKKARDKLSHSS